MPSTGDDIGAIEPETDRVPEAAPPGKVSVIELSTVKALAFATR